MVQPNPLHRGQRHTYLFALLFQVTTVGGILYLVLMIYSLTKRSDWYLVIYMRIWVATMIGVALMQYQQRMVLFFNTVVIAMQLIAYMKALSKVHDDLYGTHFDKEFNEQIYEAAWINTAIKLAIDKLQTFIHYTKYFKYGASLSECPICAQKFDENVKYLYKCGHVICVSCRGRMIEHELTKCPVCRNDSYTIDCLIKIDTDKHEYMLKYKDSLAVTHEQKVNFVMEWAVFILVAINWIVFHSYSAMFYVYLIFSNAERKSSRVVNEEIVHTDISSNVAEPVSKTDK